MDRVDIITGTLGKALGGASGGYTAGRKELVEWLRQRSRPYLFSNSLAPAIVAASIEVLSLLEEGGALRDRLWANARLFREKMSAAGFTLAGADHAIIPVMLGEAKLAQDFANALLKEGIYVTGFFFLSCRRARPVFVPRCLQAIPLSKLNVPSRHLCVLVSNLTLLRKGFS